MGLTTVDRRWICGGKRAERGCTTEMADNGSPASSLGGCGGGLCGKKARGASVGDGEAARATHEERKELAWALVVRVVGGGAETNFGEGFLSR